MLLQAHEILGTDKPILKEREINHFFLDEITELGENPEKYEIVAYVRVVKKEQTFFRAVFAKKG